MTHTRKCPTYGNYQPPYEDCTCGYEEMELVSIEEPNMTEKSYWTQGDNKRLAAIAAGLKTLSELSGSRSDGELIFHMADATERLAELIAQLSSRNL